MSHLIGHGRYKGEAYPIAGGGGGGGSSSVPLSRQRFIDGDTVQTGLNGSAAQPFKTIAQFIASRGNASIADATANYVGWVMPALNGYTESVAFPPYASTELRADSVSVISGTTVTGNVTWANVAGTFAATVALAALHNVTVVGNVTVTDDGGAPSSAFIFSGDELGGLPQITGSFTSSASAHLVSASFTNALISGAVNAGTGASNATVNFVHSTCVGDVSANGLSATDSIFTSAAITMSTLGPALFKNCQFSGGPITLTCLAGARFDGPSWMSFVENGFTRAAGTIVLVTGGYNGGSVEGAALTGASTDVSLNGTGATAGFTGENSGNHYTTSNGTPTTVTLKTGGGELVGDTILITKTDTGANAVAVKNNAAATIGTITANNRGFVLARYNGSDWVFVAGGALPE